MMLVFWAVLLSTEPFRAYDRIPQDPELKKFYPEEMSRKIAERLLRSLGITETLFPSDDWLMLDSPYQNWITKIDEIPPVPEFEARVRMVEIPQEWLMPDDRGVWRSYMAYKRAGSFGDSIKCLTSAGDSVTIDIQRGGKLRKGED